VKILPRRFSERNADRTVLHMPVRIMRHPAENNDKQGLAWSEVEYEAKPQNATEPASYPFEGFEAFSASSTNYHG
jgi:hypothetical protein